MNEPGGAGREPGSDERRRWLTGPRLLLVALLVSVSLALLGGAGQAQRYFVESSASCNACHAPATSDVHVSAHQALACASCHDNHFDQNVEQWALSLVSDATTEHGRIDLGACKTCHAAGTVEPWRLARTQGHVAHVLDAKEPLACGACHELSRHQTTPKPDECARCHTEIALFDHGAGDMPGAKPAPCLSCHEYLARTDVGKKALVTDCRRCHGGAKANVPVSEFATTIPGATVSPGQIHANLQSCGSCHDPHAESPDARNLGADCTRCHDRVSEELHAQKLPAKFTCSTCHEVHGPRAALTASCQTCHAQSTEPTTTLAREHERCTQCHAAHEFVAPEKGCQSCHAEAVLVLAGWGAKKHADCKTCHEPHDAAPESARCATCHQKANDHGHPSCASCHEPHQDGEHVAACSSCHQPEVAKIQSALPAHRTSGCATCHQPHAPGFEVAACRTCHASEVRLVATAKAAAPEHATGRRAKPALRPESERRHSPESGPGHQQCAACHEPHVFGASQSQCSTCHAIPTDGPHSGACLQCHQAHGPPIGRAQGCASCHAEVPRPLGKHTECTSCHAEAHAQSAGLVQDCRSCHANEATAASTWQAPTHQACEGCHEKHQPTKPAACASCHGELATKVKPTGHGCASCHEVHAPPVDLWGSCANCHAGPVAAAAPRGPVHSACKSCHEAHSAAAPTCQSCHEKPAALHGVPEHQRCQSCHSTHAETRSTRAQCLTCHEPQTDHFPEANSCAGCHLFK